MIWNRRGSLLTAMSGQFSGTGLKARALRGSGLTLIGFGGANVMRLASNLILTRILFPEAFGLMALVQVFIAALAMFSDFGLHTSIVQSRREDRAFLDTAWSMMVIRGLFLGLMAAAVALPAAAFYEQEMLRYLLPVVGLNAVIQGFTPTKFHTAARHLMLGRVTVIELVSQAAGILAMIVLALIYRSVWALAIGGVLGMAVKVLLSFVYLPGPTDRFRFERAAFGELFHFGKYLFLSSICGFLVNNGDRAILGKFVTLSELAFYNIAFFFATVPLMLSMRLVNAIMLPLYRERPTEESQKNRNDIARARALITLTMGGLTLGLGVLGDWMIRLLYTPDYHTAGPILTFLALAMLPGLITLSYPTLLMARGNSRGFFITLLARAGVQTTLFYFGMKAFGLAGAIIAPPLSAIVTYPVILALLRPYHALDLRHDIGFTVLAVFATIGVILFRPDTLAALLALIPA